MPKIGDTLTREQALALPATPAELQKLCNKINRKYSSKHRVEKEAK